MTKLKYDDKNVESMFLGGVFGDGESASKVISRLQDLLDNTPPEYHENVIVIPKCEEGYEGEHEPFLAIYYLREKTYEERNKERLQRIENLKYFIKSSEQEIAGIEKEFC